MESSRSSFGIRLFYFVFNQVRHSHLLDFNHYTNSRSTPHVSPVTLFYIINYLTQNNFSGHAFGAGLFFAMACDYRIMRTKRGYLNFPEVNLGMRLQKQFGELAKCKLTPSAVRKAVLEAHRFSGDEAKEFDIVDEVVPVENLLSHSVNFAFSKTPSKLKFMNFDPRNFKAIKIEMYTDAYRALSTKGLHNPNARL